MPSGPKSADMLIREADRARRAGRLVDAHRDLTKAVSLCRREGASAPLLRALKALGRIERDLGHDETSLVLYEEAAALCRDADDAPALAHTVRHLGDIHRHAGRVEPAEACYAEALDLYRSLDRSPTLDLANAIRPLAILREETDRAEEARRLWAEARDLYASAGVGEGVAECEARLRGLLDDR